MNTFQKRFALFIFGCIGTRLAATFIAKIVSPQVLPYLGAIALIPIIGWLYIMFIGKRDTGPEVFGGKIWWKSMRPIHTLLYAIFAFLAFNKNPNAWIALLADTLLGLSAFTYHHYTEGNFGALLQCSRTN
jgi:hypothetical protein